MTDRPRRRPESAARRADRYDLYQRSVQDPEHQVRFLSRVFRRHHGRPPAVLREDFCAAAAIACRWVAGGRDRVAYGLDIDPEPIQWGLEHNAASLTEAQRARLHLVVHDVLDPFPEPVDIVFAGNFSYFVFKTRAKLLQYFRAVRGALSSEGVFVLDIFGGPEAQRIGEDIRRNRGWLYVWDQESFNPITGEIECIIHFRFPDGSEIRNAFSYDWRLWTIPELRDALADAGFSKTEVYWEDAAEDGTGTGVFRRKERAPSEEGWIAYVAALP